MASRLIVFAVFACVAQGSLARSSSESSNETKVEIIRIERIQSTSGLVQAIGSLFARTEDPNTTTTLADQRYNCIVGLAAGIQSFLTTHFAVLDTSQSEINETWWEYTEVIRNFTDIVHEASSLAEIKNGDYNEIVSEIRRIREQIDTGAFIDLYFKLIPLSSKVEKLKERAFAEATNIYDNVFLALVNKVTLAYKGEAADTDFKNLALTATVSFVNIIFDAIWLQAEE